MKGAKKDSPLLKLQAKNLKNNVALQLKVAVDCNGEIKEKETLVKLRNIRTIKSLKDLGIRPKSIKVTPKSKAKFTNNV